jgi:hypothetical protein
VKPIAIILTRCDDQDMLTVNGPPFMCIAAERFVIEDRRPAERVKIKPETVGFVRGGMLFLEPPARWRVWQRDIWTCCGQPKP